MSRSPQAGDSYRACPHLAAVPPSSERHFWEIPGHEPWIVLGPVCHVVFSLLRSVEIQDATFRLAPDPAGALGASSVSHCAPGDYVVEPISSSPTTKPPPAAPLGKLLQLRPPGRDPAWLPLVDKALHTLSELVSAHQQQAQTREALLRQRMDLENRALEQLIRALQASTATISAMNSMTTERERAFVSLAMRLTEATGEPTPPPRTRPRQKPPRNRPA